jgi:hypothetical protein
METACVSQVAEAVAADVVPVWRRIWGMRLLHVVWVKS